MERLELRPIGCTQSATLSRYVRYLDDFPAVPLTQSVDRHRYRQLRRSKSLRRPDSDQGHRALPADDHRSGDLVLDPTCGSGTTAYVAEQWGRRWITIDTSRVALALARTRLMAGTLSLLPARRLAEGRSEGGGADRQSPPCPARQPAGDVRKGFVYKRVPHITLKSSPTTRRSTRSTPAGRSSWNRCAPKLNTAARARRGRNGKCRARARRRTWRREAARRCCAEWWELRRERQAEIDASIARHADTELLYDQPYEDNKRIRVTGPVHRREPLAAPRARRPTRSDRAEPSGEARADAQARRLRADDPRQPAQGRRPEHRQERAPRLRPPRALRRRSGSTPPASTPTATARRRRVAVSHRPRARHGRPGAGQGGRQGGGAGRRASTCSSSAASPSTRTSPKRPSATASSTVLPTRMNPDLAMGDELLKKTGAGNLFMVFGEPDLEIADAAGRQAASSSSTASTSTTPPPARSAPTPPTTSPAGSSTPTTTRRASSSATPTSPAPTSPTRSSSAPCGPRSTRPPGRASTAPSAAPSTRPTTGKIAVKVINHYGDEVLKVYAV